MYFFFLDPSITLRELHPPPISRLPVNWPTLVSHRILKNLSIFISWTVTNHYYDSIVYVILLSMKLRNIEQNQSYYRFIFIKSSWIYWKFKFWIISCIKLYIVVDLIILNNVTVTVDDAIYYNNEIRIYK